MDLSGICSLNANCFLIFESGVALTLKVSSKTLN